MIKIHVLFITETSFQAAALILNQKSHIQKCAALILIIDLISGILSAVSVIAAECTGILSQFHIPVQLPIKKCLCLLYRHEKYRLFPESRSPRGTLLIHVIYSHCKIFLHYCQLVIKHPYPCHSESRQLPIRLNAGDACLVRLLLIKDMPAYNFSSLSKNAL